MKKAEAITIQSAVPHVDEKVDEEEKDVLDEEDAIICDLEYLFPVPKHDRMTLTFRGKEHVIYALPGEFQHTVIGEVLWRGATALCELLSDESSADNKIEPSAMDAIRKLPIKGSKVIELGAGCGLVGLVCLKGLGAECAYLTDYEESVMRLLRRNASENDVDSSFVQTLDWTLPVNPEAEGFFDIAVASDVIYWRELVDPYFKCAGEIIREGGYLIMVNGYARFLRNTDVCELYSQKYGFTRIFQTSMDNGVEIISLYQKNKKISTN